MYQPGTGNTGELPRLDPAVWRDHDRVVVHVPGHDLKLEMRRALLHCTEKNYDIAAVCIGERAWPGARSMLELGEAERIVTTSRSAHTSEPGVEIAGAGRLTIRTPARATRLRQIADLLDSGLSVSEIVRILRG